MCMQEVVTSVFEMVMKEQSPVYAKTQEGPGQTGQPGHPYVFGFDLYEDRAVLDGGPQCMTRTRWLLLAVEVHNYGLQRHLEQPIKSSHEDVKTVLYVHREPRSLSAVSFSALSEAHVCPGLYFATHPKVSRRLSCGSAANPSQLLRGSMHCLADSTHARVLVFTEILVFTPNKQRRTSGDSALVPSKIRKQPSRQARHAARSCGAAQCAGSRCAALQRSQDRPHKLCSLGAPLRQV